MAGILGYEDIVEQIGLYRASIIIGELAAMQSFIFKFRYGWN